jgi:NADH-quinone oxidoreductase subunit G
LRDEYPNPPAIMPKLNIDGTDYEFENGTPLIEACGQAGIEIPRFCYHERLSIAGNCRMCLIEVVGGPPKPQASCAMTVNDLRPGKNGEPPQIKTNSPMVKAARHGVMEFLLINHPLDCPICDQGGECDLQDQAMGYGFSTSRFIENKRAVEDKFLGPLVKTAMTRCIQCTRCVRFMTEVAGVEELGAISRGEDMEIVATIEKGLSSELSANIVDLCPVGALTAKPIAFHARPWELRKTESIDVNDALGANIRVDTRGSEVVRVLPRVNDAINEEWISDKTRHVVDGLKTQRVDRPYIREGGKLRPVSWAEALKLAASRMVAAKPSRLGALAGDLAGLEEMYALKLLLGSLGSAAIDCRQDLAALDPSLGRASYLFNSGVAAIEDADALLIVGSNPRLESPVLNARIRKRWLRGGFTVTLVGPPADLTYKTSVAGAGPDAIAEAAQRAFAGKQKPMLILGQGALARPDGRAVLAAAAAAALANGAVKDGWNGFNVLHSAAARVGGLEIGFVPGNEARDAAAMIAGEMQVLYLLGADEVNLDQLGNTFVIYQGTHGDVGAHRADVILPGAAYTEKSAIYVNTEGRPQMTARAVFPPGDAKEDWAIVRALSAEAGKTLPFDSLSELRSQIFRNFPHLAALGTVKTADRSSVGQAARSGGTISREPFRTAITDFFLTNPIARASRVMAECSRARSSVLAEAAE